MISASALAILIGMKKSSNIVSIETCSNTPDGYPWTSGLMLFLTSSSVRSLIF